MNERKSNLRNIITKGPDFALDTPLDNFFTDLEKELIAKLSLFTNDESSNQGSLYAYLGFLDNKSFVDYLLTKIKKLHLLIIQRQNDLIKDKNNLLPISLHDMKYMDQLFALLIVHGIDANLTPKLRIPLELRRLKSFKNDDKTLMISKEHTPDSNTLRNVLMFLYGVITCETNNLTKENYLTDRENEANSHTTNRNDYLRSVIIKGPLYTNLYLGFLQLHISYPEDSKILSKLNKVEDCQDTYSLFTLYTFLTQCIQLAEAKLFILDELTTLPIRRETNGLITLIDFVLGVREDEQIDNEKIQRVNKIVLSKPKNISNKEYLTKIFDQIYDGMTFVNRPILITCLNGITTEFFYKNKKIVRDFLFKKIYEILFNYPVQNRSIKELNDMFNVLISLSKNVSTDLIIDLTTGFDERGFYLNIWIYCLFLLKYQKVDPIIANNFQKENNVPYYEVILSLLQTFIIITNNYSILEKINLNLLNFDHDDWAYCIDLETQLPYVKIKNNKIYEENSNIIKNLTKTPENQVETISQLFKDMDLAIELYMKLLHLVNHPEIITRTFLSILSRWIQYISTNSSRAINSNFNINSDQNKEKDAHDNSIANKDNLSKNLLIILDLKILQKINEDFKTDLVTNKKDVLLMITKLLDFINVEGTLEEDSKSLLMNSDERDSDDEDEDEDKKIESNIEIKKIPTISLQIVTELLELIVSDLLSKNGGNRNKEFTTLLLEIEKKLACLQTTDNDQLRSISDVKDKIQGYISRNQLPPSASLLPISKESSQLKNDKEILNRALINLSDNLAPIRVHGLTELRQLIKDNSTVISIDRVVRIHLQNLKNLDPFVYLNAIKGLTELVEISPIETLTLILIFYSNESKKYKVGEILRAGEVIVNYIQRENKLFQGEYANKIIDICLNKVRQHGKLDNRLRMSAMSILGVCLQVNALGIRNRVREILDCVFGVLTLESSNNTREKNKSSTSFVMRRSAVHLIHDLLYNADMTLFPKEYNLARIKTLLEYTKMRDDDYLVCEQINQLLDILEKFHVSDVVTQLSELD